MTSRVNYKVTKHAADRYCERLEKLGATVPAKPILVIRKLLDRSVEEDIDPAIRVKRIIQHRFETAEYRVYQGWRFVIVDNVVKTVERVNPIENH